MPKATGQALRDRLKFATRVVVKVGTRVLVDASGRPEAKRLGMLATDISALVKSGKQVVLVTSGAIGAGIEVLGMKRRPKALPDLQMAAAVGQSRLMEMYARAFAKRGLAVGQILLTYDDLRHRVRHVNAKMTMGRLLEFGIVPIVNENDVVSVDEIKVGDNDVLASLVTSLIGADVLVLLSSTDGLRKFSPSGRSSRVSSLEAVTEKELALVFGKGSDLSVGGMGSKLQAAQTAVRSGAISVIADGREKSILKQVFAGADVGTIIGGRERVSRVGGRKQWIAFFERVQGSVVIDEGARIALEEKGHSLLPIGVKSVEGDFQAGASVNVQSLDGALIARGLVGYSSGDLRLIRGKRTQEIHALLGQKRPEEVIHRDNLVMLQEKAQ